MTEVTNQTAPNHARALPQPGADPTQAPPWWLTKPKEIRAFLESLAGVTVEEIGQTAGGRPIVAAAWGEREMLPGRTSSSLQQAIAGRDPSAFYGKGERRRQVLLFVGATHGTECEGTVAMLNYLNIVVTGKDLLGREWPAMAEEGRRHRFLIVPILNVDGRERALDHVSWLNVNPDYHAMISQGMRHNGEIIHWPASKLYQPMSTAQFRIVGTYMNDAGINLLGEPPLGADAQPETTAWLRYARRELPDCVLFSHSDNGSLVEAPNTFIPSHYRQRVAQIAALVGMRCRRAGLAKSGIVQRPGPYSGETWGQEAMAYHACGALPLLVEFPQGWKNVPDTHQGILDIGLHAIDEICAFGNRYRFRPRDPQKA
ncbi:MAG: hypothetical protein JXR37_28755 [Kiritimatiellae bacterium]|nr:hypothetical protein [Kiritimatiellia bacterium]